MLDSILSFLTLALGLVVLFCGLKILTCSKFCILCGILTLLRLHHYQVMVVRHLQINSFSCVIILAFLVASKEIFTQ